MNVKGLFRINYIRNHCLQFGFLEGIKIYLKLHIFKNNSMVNIQLHRYKYEILLRKNLSDIKVFEKSNTSWLNNVSTIVIELHDWIKEGCAKSFFKAITQIDFEFSFTGENCLVKFKHQ